MDSHDLLQEEEVSMKAPYKSGLTVVLLVILAAYLLFILLDSVAEVVAREEFITDITSVVLIAVVFLVPLTGTLLLWANKKAGWIICGIYFIFLAVYGTIYFAGMALNGGNEIYYRNSIITLMSVTVVLLMMQKSICRQFNISSGVMITVVLIPLVVLLLLYFTEEGLF